MFPENEFERNFKDVHECSMHEQTDLEDLQNNHQTVGFFVDIAESGNYQVAPWGASLAVQVVFCVTHSFSMTV